MAAAKSGSNGYDAKLLSQLVSRVDDADAQLATLKGSYMKSCRDVKESRQGIIEEAEARGIPKKEFKAILKAREAQRRLDAIRDALEPDSQDTFDALQLALGMLDEEQAAVAARGTKAKAEEQAEAVDTFAEPEDEGDVRPRFMQANEATRAKNAQVQPEGIEHLAGIKELPPESNGEKQLRRRGRPRLVEASA